MKIKAIINPVSGRSSARSVIADVLGSLKSQHALRDGDIFYTLPGDYQLGRAFFDDCDIVFAAGGDGTLNYAINNMKRNGIDRPIAYLPVGTTNDFGSALRLPKTAEKFCDMLRQSETRQLDLGLANGAYFHYVVSGGAMAAMCYDTNQRWKNMLGRGAYVLSTLKNLPRIFEGVSIKFESEELRGEEDAALLLVSNSPNVGGFRDIIPGAKFDDGQLHVLIIRKNPLIKTARIFLDTLRGVHIKHPDVRYFKTKKVEIALRGDKNSRIGVDGERGGAFPVKIEVVPRGMTLIVPKYQSA
ncbi:diacylglycerol kinase [Clostridia bacterium]|nr:diacylglycerol kinase [Clostridia bacterium]